MARRRPLVDGGAGQPPLLRRRAGGRRARSRLPRRGGGPLVQPERDMKGSVALAQAIEEAAGRCVEVEAAHRLVPGDAEAVDAVARGCQEEARTRDVTLVAGAELDRAFEDEERVHVVGVGVRVDALEGA